MELDFASDGESQLQVEFDRAMVLRADMEPGDQAFAAVISREMPDKTRSMAPTTICGVRADAANFGVAVECDTFAAHRDQFSVGTHAEI